MTPKHSLQSAHQPHADEWTNEIVRGWGRGRDDVRTLRKKCHAKREWNE